MKVLTRNWLVYTAWIGSWDVLLKVVSISGLAAVVVDEEQLSSSLLPSIVSLSKFISLKLKSALYQQLLLIKDTWAKETNCWKKAFSFMGWKNELVFVRCL